jgi:hypothetical protein
MHIESVKILEKYLITKSYTTSLKMHTSYINSFSNMQHEQGNIISKLRHSSIVIGLKYYWQLA